MTDADGVTDRAATRMAWIDFFDADFQGVVQYLMRIGAGLDDARDAAQEAFLESWREMTGRPDRWAGVCDRRAWVRVVAARRYRRPPGPRRRPLTTEFPDEADWPSPEPEPGELTAQTQAVLQALRSLDEEVRVVMALSMDGFPNAIIAVELDITPQRVRDLLRRGRAALKRDLRHLLGDGKGWRA